MSEKIANISFCLGFLMGIFSQPNEKVFSQEYLEKVGQIKPYMNKALNDMFEIVQKINEHSKNKGGFKRE